MMEEERNGRSDAEPCRRVGCLGPEGSYSEIAAKRMRADYGIVLYADFSAVVEGLLRGETDFAVLPIENSIQGGVLKNLDLLAESDVFEIEECVLSIDHRLAMLEGVRLSDIERVYSHEQAIGQCSRFLHDQLPKARCIFTSSTAESLSRLDARSAGIVGSHVRREGIVLSEDNIADEKKNYTRFMLLEKRRVELPAFSTMVFFCAVTEHKPGALVELLQIFARYGLNLTRIESRPIKDSFGEYRFFIEFAGDIGDKIVLEALAEAKRICLQFRVLGAYNEKTSR